MGGRTRCDGCGTPPRSKICREPLADGSTFCYGCHERVRRESLEPGEDFEQYKLWSAEVLSGAD